ncbi:MAG: chaperone modulator CbpM [Chitinophagales bacterium]
MQTENMIVLEEFCANHQLEISFIRSLEEYGLVEISIINQTLHVPASELSQLERMARLHQELNINPEGIDAINNLLKRIEGMQNEITELRNKISFYEEK